MDAQVCEHIVEDELLDLEVHHHVSVELALEQPPQWLQVGDVVPDLSLAAGGPSAPSRHGPEEQPRRSVHLLGPRGRPAGPGLEGAVVYHNRDRCGGQIMCGELIN